MMKKPFRRVLFLGIVQLLLFSGCYHTSGKKESSGRDIIDMLGRKVKVPEKVEKVVGVGPGALRLLVYMDLVDRVSGVEDVELRPGRPYTFAHSELTDKPIIGPYMGGDSELITVNNPDVIFMAFSSATAADELQQRTGLPVVGLSSGNLRNARDTLFKAFDLIGEITGKTVRADSLKRFIEVEITQLDSLTAGVPFTRKPEAYIGAVSYRGAHGISSTEAYYTPFELVNAINVAGGLREKEPINPTGTYVDVEQIIQWNPATLFIDAAGLNLVHSDIEEGTPLASTLKAVKEGDVYTLMPHNWYATNFENVLANAWFVGKILYPQRFSHVDAEKKAREIYRFFLGEDVYKQMKDTYKGWEKL